MSGPLLASLAALGVGPLVYARVRTGRWAAAVDAFALVGVGGLVLVHVLPQSVSLAGWWVVPLALLGLFGPGAFCGTRLFSGKSSARVAMPLALIGLAMHAVLDGVALAPGHGHGGEGRGDMALALAVILHRIPVGLGIWWLARPMYGLRTATSLLAAIGVFSVVGFFFGEALLANTSERAIALFQALVAGSLMHVILRHPPTLPASVNGRGRHVASGLGAIAGTLLVIQLGSIELHDAHILHVSDAGATFVSLALESAPALLFAYVAVAFVHTFLFDLRRLLGGGGALSQSLRGTFAGLPVPICSCGVIPLYRSLVVRGVSPTAAMAFLVATPELGIASLFLSWSLLGPEITGARLGAAIVLALAAALLIGRRAPSPAPEATPDDDARTRPPFGRRLREGFRFGFGDMVDDTLPWLVVGIGIAALAEPLLLGGVLERLPSGLEIPLFALAGLPLYVCASGSTPIVAVLIAQGASPGAAIAFLLTGPATNVTTFGVLSGLHGRRTALSFALLIAGGAIGLGYVANALVPASAAAIAAASAHGAHEPTTLQIASLAGLGVLLAVSLMRQGARGFVGQVLPAHGHDHAHDDCGEPEHAHAHSG